MAIYAITGKPRHGKTYFLNTQIVKWLKKGIRIYSNVKLNLGVGALKKFNDEIVGDIYNKQDLANDKKILFYWRNIHEWNHMKTGIIIADEATRYFNPRKWAQLSEDTEIKLQQHGKDDLDVYLTVQHYSRLDVTLRVLIERFYNVERLFGTLKFKNHWFPWWGLIKITEQEFDDINMPPQDLNSFVRILKTKFCNVYDTRQAVGRSETMPLVHHMRECSDCGKVKIDHF